MYCSLVKVAFIHNEKKIGTGAHYINDLMSLKLKEAGVEMKNFYPKTSIDAPAHLSGLKNILFFYSLLEKRKNILKYDLVQGTTYTPLPFLAYDTPIISHFGSTSAGFLKHTPRASKIEECTKHAWYMLKKEGAIKELNIKTRRPLRDIAEIEQYVALKATVVIATSLIVKKELMEMGVEEKKIHLIYNAIEDYWFENHKPDFVEDPSIVFIGRIGSDAFNLKLKGFDRLIHMYQHFPDVKKTTICMTQNKSLTSWIINNSINHSLFVNLKKDKIPETIKKLRGGILFIPSRYEGFSLSLIEGMSQGLVPIVFSVGVAPEIIISGFNGFIVTSQEEAIKKVKLLLADPELRKKCALEAEKTAHLFFGSRIAKELMVLYEKVGKKVK